MLLLLYVLCFQSHCLRIVSKIALKILRRGKARQILVMCTPLKNSYFVKEKKGELFFEVGDNSIIDYYCKKKTTKETILMIKMIIIIIPIHIWHPYL